MRATLPTAVLAFCAVLAALVPAGTSAPARVADDNPTEAPAEAKPGRVYARMAEDGLPFEYRVPEGYDAERGANLTLVLHGNGLDHRWTFWNHPPDEFRVADIVVSPDGTTFTQGTNANEFLGGDADARRVHALIEELKATWNVRQVFLYGHSQGSFFVFYYAGKYPDDVDGVLGHASGMWNGTAQDKRGHHVAVAFMHGTNDHIPYGQSEYGAQSYRDAGYPNVNLRTLFDWGHPPHYHQAEQELAWCEGVTSELPERVAACLDELADEKRPMGVDWGALYAVAARLKDMEGAGARDRERATKIAEAVDELAREHVAAIEKALGKGKLTELDGGAWSGHVTRFLADFRGVPACAEFVDAHERELDKVEKNAADALKDYWRNKERKPREAFEDGLKLLEGGWSSYRCGEVLEQLELWAADARELKLSKSGVKRLKELADDWRDGRKDGFQEYEKRNRKADL